ncbi:MAG: sugar transferase [Halioglobus sp.]|nr:sugar transferase [Halioglobus sp.]|tara:strand:+ start:4597 stop:6009 length:1413 start_codon:yes stop_codon:yes gene_type:complete
MATVRVFNHHVHTSFYWLALIDAALFAICFYAGTYLFCTLQLEAGSFHQFATQVPGRAIMYGLVAIVCLSAMGLYEPRMREGRAGILIRALGGFGSASLLMGTVFYLLPDFITWRGSLFYAVLLSFTASLISRTAFTNLADLDQFKSRVLIYGSGFAASTITSSMRRKTDRQGFNIVGFVRVDGEEPRVTGERIINLRQPLAEYAQQTEIDQIVVALDNQREQTPKDELFKCRLQGVKVLNLVNFFEREAGKILVDFASPAWMTLTEDMRSGSATSLTKRAFDILASFILLMGTWPVMLVTAVAIWFEDGFGAPIFFSQERVGLNGKAFRVLKFRSMTVDAEGDGKARWATKNDSRVTRVGSFIRRTRIDELPQIFNVLAGDMAFIGPRPERPEFVQQLAEQIPFYDSRHAVKPGITGWAQLCYPYGASTDDARQKLQFDLYYVKNHSLFLDFMITLSTVEVVLFGKGAR